MEEEIAIPRRRPIKLSEMTEEPLEFRYFFHHHYNQAERLMMDINKWREGHPDRLMLLDKLQLLDLIDYCFELTELPDFDLEENEELLDPFDDPYFPEEEEIAETPESVEVISPPSDTEENKNVSTLLPWNKVIEAFKTAFFHIEKS